MTNLEHYELNKITFDFWVAEHVNGRTPKLEVSNDIFAPLIEPFKKSQSIGKHLRMQRVCT